MEEKKNIYNVDANKVIKDYQQKVSDLEFQVTIKDEQLKNAQEYIVELEKKLKTVDKKEIDNKKKQVILCQKIGKGRLAISFLYAKENR